MLGRVVTRVALLVVAVACTYGLVFVVMVIIGLVHR